MKTAKAPPMKTAAQHNAEQVGHIDVPAKAVALREHQEIAPVEKGSPLDLPPALFRAGLDRRGENRKALMAWIREALVDGIDYGRIHVVGKDRCREGKDCKNLAHFSKPCLYKPGAEKICGMIGVIPTFPRLTDYEQACLNGVELKHILLRCEMVNQAGQVVGHGAGARTLEKDYNDLNKSLKMAEKSALCDACLRMAGLSEVFTQDEEDNENFSRIAREPDPDDGYLPKESERAPSGAGGQPSASEPRAQSTPVPQTPAGNPTLKAATAATRQWMIDSLNANPKQPGRDITTSFFQQCGWMLPTESLEELELRFVPSTKRQLDLLVAAINDYSTSGTATKPYNPNPEMPQDKPQGKTGTNVPRGTKSPAQPGKAAQGAGKPVEVPRDDAWKQFPIPFGKRAGQKLGALAIGDKNDQDYLYGWWAKFEVNLTYEGRNGEQVKKSPAQLAKDKAFRAALDAAGQSLGFTKEET